ncbi:YciI family protein [Nocardia harenae]|uniref:YciI family protein n=1 Tax=Nocardia harenae TaxID=358707 RepID=UPI00082984E8|nr:YciI family protein [Nocardia harenae]
MYYLAVLLGAEGGPDSTPGTPEFDAEVARYAAFDAAAGEVVAGGAALAGTSEAVRLTRQDGRILATDGPFAESAEVVGGFYVLDVADLDAAIDVAGRLPAVSGGAVEVRPVAQYVPHAEPGAHWWAALLWERPEAVIAPGTQAWEAAVAEHGAFADAAGAALTGGVALHPPGTATTLRAPAGELLLTDGPFAEAAEVLDGLYLFTAPDRAAAIDLAGKIPLGPTGATEVRPVLAFG